MSEVVLKELQDGVATLTLNRPERLNAWTQELERAYFDGAGRVRSLARRARDRRDRRGRGFCAGADMQELQTLGEHGVERRAGRAGAHPADIPADRAQADHRGDQRPMRGHRAGAGADVRSALRRRGREADDRVRSPRPGRRARHLLGASSPGRSGARAGPAPVRARRARARSRGDGSGQHGDGGARRCSSRRSPTRATWPSTARRRAWRR